MDDFNELAKHDFFQNATVTHENVFLHHPHLSSYICMHAEEVVKVLVENADTVAGKERFGFAHFPGMSACHSVLFETSSFLLFFFWRF